MKFLVPIIDCLELAAVDRDASFGKEAHAAAEHNKPAADLADGQAVVLAEIGDRLVIRNTTSRQPHDLDVAPGLALKPSARLDPVQIAVNIELQEDRRMIGGSPCRFRIDPAEIERTEIKLLDKHVNHTNRVVLVDPIIQAFGKQRRLPAVRPLDKALHRDLPPKIASEPYHARRFHTAWVDGRLHLQHHSRFSNLQHGSRDGQRLRNTVLNRGVCQMNVGAPSAKRLFDRREVSSNADRVPSVSS